MNQVGHNGGLEGGGGEEPSHKRARLSLDNTVSGTILRIRLEHFMCHEELDWLPNKNINFVTGENGSGKSSILQGLVIGLLADSRHTKRYSKLQDFIQKDYQRALVQVTLRNEGEDAYMPDVYGKSITLQRTINKNGSNQVIILNEKMKKVQKKTREARDEGKRILELFRINTDNPIVILQQEEAKELLKVESPGNLYNFFQKATLLKQCIDQYSGAEMELEKTRTTISSKKEHIKELAQQVKILYEKMQSLERMIERDAEEDKLKKEYAWALVIEHTKHGEEIQQKSVENENAVKAVKTMLNKMQQALEKMEKDQLKETDKLTEERQKFQNKEAGLLLARQNINKLKEQEKQCKKKVKGLEQMKTTASTNVQILKEQLDKQSNSQANKEKLVNKREVLERKMISIGASTEEARAERDKLATDQEANTREVDNKEYEHKGWQSKLARLEVEVLEMKGLGEANLVVFNHLAPKVADEVREAFSKNLFQTKPIGPVGSFVKLGPEASSNPQLAKLLETEIGSNQIKAYLCDNDKDRSTLWEILNRVYGQQQKKPMIFTSKFLHKRHLVKKVEGGHKTVMDFLDIIGSTTEATVIFNHLVDQKSIETVVICKNQEEAKKITTFAENVPRNMSYAITHDFYRFFPPTKKTSYRSYYMHQSRSNMLGANMSDKVKEKHNNVLIAQSTISDINLKMDQLKRTKAELKDRHNKIMDKISGMQQELMKTNRENLKLKAEEEGLDTFEALQGQLEKKQNELGTILNNIKTTIDKKEQVGNQIKEKSLMIKDKTKELFELQAFSDPIKREISKIEGLIHSKKKEIAKLKETVRGHQITIDKVKKELENNQVEMNRVKKVAMELTKNRELKPTHSVIQLNAKLKQLCAVRRKQQGSAEAQRQKDIVSEEYRQKKEQYDTHKGKMEALETMVKAMDKMNERRSSNFIYIRKSISNIIANRFALESETFSSQFGNTISLEISHQRREINFKFRSHEGDEIRTDVNSLSGGEKSLVQICLIASLWETMNPPFRALDEWDVFLDNINRKSISGTLLGLGLSKQDYQFIFISPQGAGDVDVHPADRSKVTVTEIKKTA